MVLKWFDLLLIVICVRAMKKFPFMVKLSTDGVCVGDQPSEDNPSVGHK